MKRSSIFVAATIEAGLGGIARSVPALALTEPLRDGGTEVFFVAPKAKESTLDNVPVQKSANVRLCDGFNGVKRELEQLTQEPEHVFFIYHAGVWNSLNHFVARLGRRIGIPVIVSIRSMLDPWALNHRKWKKRLAWWAYARRDLLGAAAIHATAELEAGYIREALGVRCPPVIVVPNGVELGGKSLSGSGLEKPFATGGESPRPDPDSDSDPDDIGGTALRRLLFLSRIHPKKGVQDLIRAFGAVNPEDWELVIAGNDDSGHRRECERLAAQQPNAEHIHFHGPVRDADKWELYRSADLFVLPSYSENFGIVVGEALGMGVPVVTTTATPWGEYFHTHSTSSGQAGDTEGDLGLWVVDTGVEAIQGAMKEVMEMTDEERRERGARGAAWIREAFTWEAIGARFLEEVGKVLPRSKDG